MVRPMRLRSDKNITTDKLSHWPAGYSLVHGSSTASTITSEVQQAWWDDRRTHFRTFIKTHQHWSALSLTCSMFRSEKLEKRVGNKATNHSPSIASCIGGYISGPCKTTAVRRETLLYSFSSEAWISLQRQWGICQQSRNILLNKDYYLIDYHLTEIQIPILSTQYWLETCSFTQIPLAV